MVRFMFVRMVSQGSPFAIAEMTDGPTFCMTKLHVALLRRRRWRQSLWSVERLKRSILNPVCQGSMLFLFRWGRKLDVRRQRFAHALHRYCRAGMVRMGALSAPRDPAPTPISPSSSNQVRAQLIRAAKWRCQRCRRKTSYPLLVITPIDFDPTNQDPCNTVVLCVACKNRREREYNYLKKQALTREAENGVDLWKSLPQRRPNANLLLLPAMQTESPKDSA